MRLERLDGSAQVTRLTPSAPSFVVEAAPRALEVARTYTVLGVEHILTDLVPGIKKCRLKDLAVVAGKTRTERHQYEGLLLICFGRSRSASFASDPGISRCHYIVVSTFTRSDRVSISGWFSNGFCVTFQQH
ncbi:MAG: hypothetical protein P4L99_15665 [Chthoniobacter sp.]|nr:hypothetical protein [Chthoniobacter sp.]